MLGAENGNVPGTLTYGKLYFPGGVKFGCTLASVGWTGNSYMQSKSPEYYAIARGITVFPRFASASA